MQRPLLELLEAALAQRQAVRRELLAAAGERVARLRQRERHDDREHRADAERDRRRPAPDDQREHHQAGDHRHHRRARVGEREAHQQQRAGRRQGHDRAPRRAEGEQRDDRDQGERLEAAERRRRDEQRVDAERRRVAVGRLQQVVPPDRLGRPLVDADEREEHGQADLQHDRAGHRQPLGVELGDERRQHRERQVEGEQRVGAGLQVDDPELARGAEQHDRGERRPDVAQPHRQARARAAAASPAPPGRARPRRRPARGPASASGRWSTGCAARRPRAAPAAATSSARRRCRPPRRRPGRRRSPHPTPAGDRSAGRGTTARGTGRPPRRRRRTARCRRGAPAPGGRACSRATPSAATTPA